jgi:hypothetical protein
LGVADSSALVLEITGVGGEEADDVAGAPSPANGAGSRMVERRRDGTCPLAAGAKLSDAVGAGWSSIGGGGE